MYSTAVLSSYFPEIQIDLVQMFGGEGAQSMMGLSSISMAFLVWIIVLMVYVYIASVLPVWQLLQPRDFINAQLLFVGLIILYAGIFVVAPVVTAQATTI